MSKWNWAAGLVSLLLAFVAQATELNYKYAQATYAASNLNGISTEDGNRLDFRASVPFGEKWFGAFEYRDGDYSGFRDFEIINLGAGWRFALREDLDLSVSAHWEKLALEHARLWGKGHDDGFSLRLGARAAMTPKLELAGEYQDVWFGDIAGRFLELEAVYALTPNVGGVVGYGSGRYRNFHDEPEGKLGRDDFSVGIRYLF